MDDLISNLEDQGGAIDFSQVAPDALVEDGSEDSDQGDMGDDGPRVRGEYLDLSVILYGIWIDHVFVPECPTAGVDSRIMQGDVFISSISVLSSGDCATEGYR